MDNEPCQHSPETVHLCHRCKQRNFDSATLEAMELGFPALEGTGGQIGFGNLVRVKAHKKFGSGVGWLLANEVDACWWLDNRQKLSSGTLSASVGRIIAKARMKVEDPYQYKLEEIDQAKQALVNEQKCLMAKADAALRSYRLKIQELEIELSAMDVEQTDTGTLWAEPVSVDRA